MPKKLDDNKSLFGSRIIGNFALCAKYELLVPPGGTVAATWGSERSSCAQHGREYRQSAKRVNHAGRGGNRKNLSRAVP